MFIDNKYRKWYYDLCSKDATDDKVHKHHIIPKSLGGTNERTNIVKLTYRQHFIAHRLLLKITSGRDRSKMAFAMMRFGKTSKNYAVISNQISDSLKGEGNPMYGKKLTEEHKKAISGENHGMHGRCCYDVWVEKYGISVANDMRDAMLMKRSNAASGERNPMYGKKHTKERNMSHSATLTGRKYMWKDGIQKRIRPENIDAMISDGWSLNKPK